jgi:hypothetical protein
MAVFMKLDSDDEYQPLLRQIDERSFSLGEGFRYSGKAGDYTVREGDLPQTDLTSVPWFLRWFIGKYGKHTRAALLHDHLVRTIDRKTADTVFRTTLAELDVGLVRRMIMWSAVTLGSRFAAGGARRTLIIVWVLAMLTGVSTLVYAVTSGDWALAAAAVLAPLPAVVLWLDQWPAGFWAGYGVAVVGVPSLAILLFFGGYWVTERMISAVTTQPRPTDPTAL